MGSRTQRADEFQRTMVRGDTFTLDLMFRVGDPNTGTPIDMTGDAWRSTVRAIDTDAVIAELTTANGGIAANAGGTVGRLVVTAVKEVTAGWPVGSHKFDLEQTTAAGVRRTWVSGRLAVTEDQSR